MDLNNITVEQYYTDNANSKDYYISSNHNLAETPITSSAKGVGVRQCRGNGSEPPECERR